MNFPLAVRRDGIFLALAALAVSFFVFLADQRHDLGFPLDDSWIHQTYARNLADYGEWAFVRGEPSAASTAPLYSLLLAVGHGLNLAPYFWAHLMGIISLTAGAIFAARIGEQLFPKIPYIGWATGLSVLLSWHLVWAAASGMETMIFSTLTLVLINFSWRELDERSTRFQSVILRGGSFGILAALTTLARPEGVMLAGLIGLAMLVARPQGWRNLFIYGMGSAIGFGLLISPYLLLNLQLTGGLLPDTAAAKQADMLIVL
ncbi:MAG: hypothetical protein K8I82_12445, partial [Anaerolineae bacterium]|nr:hypothetical protein [Anaerolineae bacterium]